MSASFYAISHPKTKEFMRELHELFTKHDLAVVPTHEGAMSFHDHLTVVPYSSGKTESFIERTSFEDEEEEEQVIGETTPAVTPAFDPVAAMRSHRERKTAQHRNRNRNPKK